MAFDGQDVITIESRPDWRFGARVLKSTAAACGIAFCIVPFFSGDSAHSWLQLFTLVLGGIGLVVGFGTHRRDISAKWFAKQFDVPLVDGCTIPSSFRHQRGHSRP